MRNLLYAIAQLTRVERPVGTVLLATPMLWALWLAEDGLPSGHLVFIFLVGAFIMRSAGCVINDFADRNIDGNVQRTKLRPLATQQVSSKFALGLFIVLILCACVLLYFLPKVTLIPAFFAVFLVALYPFTKRFFKMPQLILGLAYSCSILMAYTAVLSFTPPIAYLLFLASVIWTIIYDTFYAMVDRNDDEKINVYSSARLFGKNTRFILSLLVVTFLYLMYLIGEFYQLGVYYYVSLFLAFLCFLYQFYITRGGDRQAYFYAFLNNQWVGTVIFLGILIDSLSIFPI